jgi:signal transduction histidine kinase
MFGFEGWSPIVHSMFWSLFVNVSLYVGFSLFTKQGIADANQAEIFVNINKYANVLESTPIWKGTANVPDIRSLLANFLGVDRTNLALNAFAQRNAIKLDENRADPKLVAYAERVLSGIIGSGSARIMVASTVKEEEIKIDEVLDILKESQYFVRLNKELKRKTEELERAQFDLLEANNRLLEQDELKDDFLTTVTHELRTPITSIRAFSEILHDNDDIDEEERKNYLLIIIKETERISRLITQVLDLEKYDSGKQKLDAILLDFGDLLKECLASVEQLLKDKGIQIHFIEPTMPFIVYGDRDKLQQVVINILSNAIKFTKDSIEIKLEHDHQSIVLDIKDNGEGIGEGMEGLIFEKFYQVKNQTIRKPKGSGLGLAISRRIVELHEGNLTLLESSHLGATFRMVLPINEKSLPILMD